MRKDGKTLAEIGREINVTRERVRQILAQAWHAMNPDPMHIEFQGLTLGVISRLARTGIRTKAQALRAIELGEIHPRHTRTWGKVCHIKLCEFLGISRHPISPYGYESKFPNWRDIVDRVKNKKASWDVHG